MNTRPSPPVARRTARERMSRVEGVLFVERDFAVITEGNGDTAPGIFGRGFAQGVFGDYEDGPGGR